MGNIEKITVVCPLCGQIKQRINTGFGYWQNICSCWTVTWEDSKHLIEDEEPYNILFDERG